MERHLRANGLTPPRNDLFVATVASRTGLTIVCRDAQFDSIRRVAEIRLTVEQT